jgi:hypothetical protein
MTLGQPLKKRPQPRRGCRKTRFAGLFRQEGHRAAARRKVTVSGNEFPKPLGFNLLRKPALQVPAGFAGRLGAVPQKDGGANELIRQAARRKTQPFCGAPFYFAPMQQYLFTP